MNSSNSEQDQLVVCGIGTSAGGLDPLKQLFAGLEPNAGAVFLIAQHLSPDHHSHLVQILATTSKMPVQAAQNGEIMQGGNIYIAPPNSDIEVDGNSIVLSDPTTGPGPKPSVSKMFVSMAEHFGDRCMAIVLSGTGSDGSAGLRSVCLAGGVTIVQDPSEAQYDGMPCAAIETRCVDMVLGMDGLIAALQQILTQPANLVQEMESVSTRDASPLQLIARLVDKNCGVNLDYYKETTLERRIQRRMAIHNLSSTDDYLNLLNQNQEEAGILARSILISVTEFFRDAAAYDDLKDVLKQRTEAITSHDTLRIWVPACATGEEAYSIAILYREIIGTMNDAPNLVIFASDMDDDAVTFARNGIYSDDSLTHINDSLRNRYFVKTGNAWQVKKALRQQVVFSVQNIVEDPPFSRLDLVSCRNLLIYLKPPIQKRVFELIHYSLRENGLLFLGQSESAEAFGQLFKVLSKSARIYRRTNQRSLYSVSFSDDTINLRVPRVEQTTQSARDRRRSTLQELAHKILCEDMQLAWAVVDEHDIVKCLSRDAGELFTLPEGPTILRIYNLLPDQLQSEVRAMLYRSRRDSGNVHGSRCVLTIGDEKRAYRTSIFPFQDDLEKLWVVAFYNEPVPDIHNAENTQSSEEVDNYIHDLESRITYMQHDLQSTTEELETSNEELQSQSEELQSSNEELQSMNEQLLTSNEELQSSNEELLTMNDEIRVKSSIAEHAAGSLAMLLGELEFPVVFFDNKLCITEANTAAESLAQRESLGLRTPVQNVDWQFDAGELIRVTRNAVGTGVPETVEVATHDGKTWQASVKPFMRDDIIIEGLMIRFSAH